MEEHAIPPIDLVVVNLYPFEQTIAREDATVEMAAEYMLTQTYPDAPRAD